MFPRKQKVAVIFRHIYICLYLGYLVEGLILETHRLKSVLLWSDSGTQHYL